MNDNTFDALVDKIQGEAFDEAKEVLGEKGFDRWRNPKFCGRLEGADGYAKLTGDCGDTMEMYIKIHGEIVGQVGYFTDGCSSSSVAGSFAAELATGMGFTEVLDLSGKDVLNEVGRFPESEEHCAHLAIRTLQEALNSYLVEQVRVNPDFS